MRSYARIVVGLRFVIIPAWVAAAVLATLWLPGLEQPGGGGLTDLIPQNTGAARVERRERQLFRFPIASDTLVVRRNPAGLGAGEQARILGRAARVAQGQAPPGLDEVRFALPFLNTLGLFPGSRERGTTAVIALFFGDDYSIATKTRTAHDYAELGRPGPGEYVGVTGAAPGRLAQYDAIRDALPIVTAATVTLIFVLVALGFRALGAPLVVLGAAGAGYVVDVRVLGWISEVMGISIPKETEPLLVVLLLGIVTDYSIFYLSGHRRRLSEGAGRKEAARDATATVTPIVLAAGALVAGSAAALLVANLDFLRAFGPGLALTALVGVAVSVTLVPAILAFFGPRLYWPSIARAAEAEEPSRWRARLAYVTTARPAAFVIALAVVGALIVAASGLRQTTVGLGLIDSLQPDRGVKRAADEAARGFAPGILGPTTLLLEQPGLATRRPQLARLEQLLAREPGVAGVLGPREQPLANGRAVVISSGGDAARYLLVLDSDPFGARAVATLRRLDRRLPELQARAGLPDARAGLGGGTALAEETISRVLHDLWRVGLVVFAVNVLLLALFLRSLVAPLVLLASSVLALCASLGLATYLFQDGLGADGLTYYVPFAAAVLLVALGSDYNVFVAGRIWTEARHRPFREAIAVAAPRAAHAIRLAGIVLALSFALLAIVPLDSFREFAFVMFAGILIDTVLVRSLLVPALISLLGPAASWPSRRLRSPAGFGPPRLERREESA